MVTVDLNNEDENALLKAIENKPDSPVFDSYTDENGTIHIIDDMDTKEDTELARAIQISLDQTNSSTNNTTTNNNNHSSTNNIPTNPDDLILRNSWTPQGDQERFPSGVGLKNIGNTCYVNALLQSYFMIPSVLKSIMKTKPSSQKSDNSPEDVLMTEANQTTENNKDASLAHLDEESSVEFLQSLQKLFANMLLSNTNFVDPSPVMQKLKDAENKPYRIGDMQDLPEFNSLFLSRLEKGMETLHKESKENISAKFKELFYGKTAVLVEAEELDHTKIEKKTVDTFNHLILPISQDTRNYMDSFELCMKDDTIEYTTDKNHKTKARKTLWFEGKDSIPPVLFLQTSRAVYDTNTLTKIQNLIDLPFDLNLGPYLLENREITEEIRTKLKVLNLELEKVDSSLKSFLESYENRDFGLIQAFEVCSNRLFEVRHEYEEHLSSSNANNIDHFSIAIQILQQQQEIMTRKVSELKEKRTTLLKQIEKAWEVQYPRELAYSLYSIIMHSGSSALGGHYWSYIKYQGDDDTWFKFNDTIVTTLTKEAVIREAFNTKGNAAYCLVYIDPTTTGKFDASFKDEIMTEIPHPVLAEIEKKNHEIIRKFKPELLQEMKKNFSLNDLLKDDMTNRLYLAQNDAQNSSLAHDYRLKSFLAFLQCIVNTASDATKFDYHCIFNAQIVNEGSQSVFSEPFFKNPENEKIAANLIDEPPIIELAKKLLEGTSKVYNDIKEDYKVYRIARLAINRALSAIANSTFTDAINYLTHSISESRKIKFKPIQDEMIKEAQSVLNLSCASLLSEMLSFLQFETGEPSKQIINFCVKCAADYGSVELCKYLLEKCDLINQQFDGCLKTYNVWIDDLRKRVRNEKVIGPNYHIDKKSIHISPQDEESYYEAEIEESKRNFPHFLSLQCAYGSDFK